MASRVNAQGKLNQVFGIIGECLDSEVCSIYLLRDGTLELYATRGLKQEAVHVTRLGLGEGLVGMIADQIETLNLDEAAAHPDFSYRPETGEELYHSRSEEHTSELQSLMRNSYAVFCLKKKKKKKK